MPNQPNQLTIMSNAVTITDNVYTVNGTVQLKSTQEGVVDLHVLVYDRDPLNKSFLENIDSKVLDIFRDDFLGIAVTDEQGQFTLSFEKEKFSKLFERRPDLYFVVKDGGEELLNTRDQFIKNANKQTPAIVLEVEHLNEKMRALINPTPAEGWKGGFLQPDSPMNYPNPDLSALEVNENRKNISKLKRQQKVVWPQFSWKTVVNGDEKTRCYQMFAPDISRLGYTNEGKVYSIICPQQGACLSFLGCMNVEVTVTGNRGWVDETNRTIAADMSVMGQIWFSPKARDNKYLKKIAAFFSVIGYDFPWNKANAIQITTFNPGHPDQELFPLSKGESTNFPIPEYAKHKGIAWSVGHLGVEIGPIKKKGHEAVDEFNQNVLDLFNIASGHMLTEGNILSWNVWFTAPETVDREEWEAHTTKWRDSIDADHGSPDGEGTVARYFDGTPFKPFKELLAKGEPIIEKFIEKYIDADDAAA